MPLKLVVDSSVIVKWLNRTLEDKLDKADQVMRDAQKGKVSLLTSELAKYEIGNVLLLRKQITVIGAKITFASLYDLPIKFVTQTKTLALDSFKAAQATKMTFYDASFVALAKQQRATLVTDNPKHQSKMSGVKVIPLEKYR